MEEKTAATINKLITVTDNNKHYIMSKFAELTNTKTLNGMA